MVHRRHSERADATTRLFAGYINATATPTSLTVDVPCNSAATLCMPRSAQVRPTGWKAPAPNGLPSPSPRVASRVVTANLSLQDTAKRGLAGDFETPLFGRLRIDGNLVESMVDGGHLCTSAPVGCGADGAARVLSAQ